MSVIQLSNVSSEELEQKEKNINESYSLNIFPKKEEKVKPLQELTDKIYMEAVFKDGRSKMQPLVNQIKKIQDQLNDEIKKHDAVEEGKSGKKFDTVAFWRNPLFKELEELIQKIFGFRNVEIHPYMEDWDSKKKQFVFRDGNVEIPSEIFEVEVSHSLRYPIEGLVTDAGFYDKSKSLNFKIYFSLKFLHSVTPEEAVAVFLHEFGHTIDPAIVDIKYTKINILSKYLTDRKSALNSEEKKFLSVNKITEFAILGIFTGFLILVTWFSAIWNQFVTNKNKTLSPKETEERIKNLRATLSKSEQFNRQNFSEAFADNFARMYGFGPQLMSALKKMNLDMSKKLRSRIKKEEERQKVILEMVENALQGQHRTNIHRARSLIKEYENDLKDPKLSAKIKKQIKEDKEEVEKVLESYTNDFSAFQNRLNKIINEELEKLENKNEKKKEKEDKKDDDKKGDENDKE